ncbi:MAG: GNAT family N-acetyltransferase, partial [Bacteroidetes bacterium]|nr:GNAT family N-acetyltransferase [Bacteroidota bacterium]
RAAGPLTAWRYLLWIGDRLAQYPDIATTEADPGPVWNAVLAWLAREYPDAWLTLRDVLPESTASAIKQHGARRSEGEEYLRLDLRGLDADSYVARCAPHMQREIRRARKRLHAERGTAGLSWRAQRAPAIEDVDQLITLNQTRFGPASWFADERNAAFFRDLAARADRELLLTSIMQGERTLHVMASYLHGNTLHYVLSGFDERAKAMSPGTMNLDHTICWAIGEGYRYFDFLRGDEGYKREFHPEQRRSIHLEWRFPASEARRKLARTMQRLRRGAGET